MLQPDQVMRFAQVEADRRDRIRHDQKQRVRKVDPSEPHPDFYPTDDDGTVIVDN